MNKGLSEGDFVVITTEAQADELLRIEGVTLFGRYMSVVCGHITASNRGAGIHLNWYDEDKVNELPFEEFRDRATETFGNEQV